MPELSIQGKKEIALNLLKSGMTIEQVVKFTGLPVELVQNLTKEITS
ncbi:MULTISPECIES: hypothetical protein [Planktothricoides]|uniref:Transposase n=2 Tax=Planktothricoides raciborskii TaxID=132608 RepID=A0AAU8JJ17_9CYAN|nr:MULTISPECIES: hypothetical protein [Planktothricoides]MBD2547736.1 hypothetical protein [Planktothricoides raciborskii FACHB-1370]MBD2586172.1 hypothetical protein [Planktothricoides raciborskii FACHB-1261]